MAKAETTKLAHSTATVAASDEQLGATLAAYHIQAAAALARQAKREESDNTAHAFEKVFNRSFGLSPLRSSWHGRPWKPI